MLTLPHTLVALVIVKFIPDPLIALPSALLSHFLLDFYVIHWNPHLYTEYKKAGRISSSSLLIILVDTLLALGFCFYVVNHYWPNLALILVFAGAVFLATLPDTIEIPYYFFGVKNRWLTRYIKFQHEHQSNGSFYWGLLTQAILVFVCLFLFFR